MDRLSGILILGAAAALALTGCSSSAGKTGEAPAAESRAAAPSRGADHLAAVKADLAKQADLLLDSLAGAHPEIFQAGERRYAVDRNWPLADSLFVEVLLQRLQEARGFVLADGAPDTLRVSEDGALLFSRREGRLQAAGAIPLRPMLPHHAEWDTDRYTYLLSRAQVVDGKQTAPAQWDVRSFPPPASDSLPGQGEQMRWAIEDGLRMAYERADIATLRRTFQGRGRCILTGYVRGMPEQGRDTVYYYLDSASAYVDRLERQKADKGQSVKVDLSLLRIYRDVSPDYRSRYWATVRQTWSTFDSRGRRLYRDDGFLFVNFDFGEDGKLSDFKIYYRLWFHNYKRSHFETGLERWERLKMDIEGIMDERLKTHGIVGRLVNGRFIPDPGEQGLRTMNFELVAKMRDDLTEAIREACCAHKLTGGGKPAKP